MMQSHTQMLEPIQRPNIPPRPRPSFRWTLIKLIVGIERWESLITYTLLFFWLISFLAFLPLLIGALHPYLPEWFFPTIIFVDIIVLLVTTIPLIPLMNHRSRPDTHGSARWASLAELEEEGLLLPERPHGTPLPLGTFGLRLKAPVALPEYKQQSHVMMVAPTGKRKTSGIIIPGLLSERGERTVIINDVKGELIDKTAGALAQHHECLIFTPAKPQASHGYNPLAHIHGVEDAQDFAKAWIANTGTSHNEPFWDRAAEQIITAIVLHIKATEPYAPLSKVAAIVCGMELDVIKELLLHSSSPQVRALTTTFLSSLGVNPKLGGSIMIELSTRFFSLLSPDLSAVTAHNHIDFDMMLQEPTALFISVPASEKERVKPLTACLYMQMMRTFARSAERTGGTLQRNVVFYLDEFANIGVIPHFLEYISLVRSMGISFILAIQDFGQLQRLYGEDGMTTILANCTTQIVFPGCGPVETNHYSAILGQTTIYTANRTVAPGKYGFVQASTATSTTGRSLMTAEELRTMYLGNLIVLSDTMKPFMVQNKTYLQRPEMQARIGLAAPTRITTVPSTDTPITGLPPAPNPNPTTEESPRQPTETEDNPFLLP